MTQTTPEQPARMQGPLTLGRGSVVSEGTLTRWRLRPELDEETRISVTGVRFVECDLRSMSWAFFANCVFDACLLPGRGQRSDAVSCKVTTREHSSAESRLLTREEFADASAEMGKHLGSGSRFTPEPRA